jgi:lipid II:glycine glycyltransferase (peptidoglycan interpeptide bridge formation enzyme)
MVNQASENLRLSNNINVAPVNKPHQDLEKVWGGIYHHPEFLKTAAKYLNLQNNARCFSIDDKLIVSLNLLSQNRPYITATTIPMMFQYFGPLFVNHTFESTYINTVLRYIKSEFDFSYICFSPEFSSIQYLQSDWNINKRITLALPEDEIINWGNGFNRNVKRNIKQAKKENVIVEESKDIPVSIWEKTFKRRNLILPVGSDELQKWFDGLFEAGLSKMYVAKIDNSPVAFRIQLFYGDFAYDWAAGSNPEYHNTGANHFLMSEIGDDISKRKIKMWDLIDARIESVAAFKKSFGAREYYHWEAYSAFNIKGRIFKLARNFRNR